MARRCKRFLVFVALCLFSFVAVYPLLKLPAWYGNQDFDRYLHLGAEFKYIIESGQWYPRWAGRLMHGFGYPTFLFYQPGYFYFLLPFTYLPVSMSKAIYFSAFAIFLISGIGAYRLARFFKNDRFLSVLFAATFMYMPYAYTNLYIRGDYSEFLAMMLCSWVFYGVFKLRKEAAAPVRKSSLLIYVLSLAAVFLSHPHVALFVIAIIVWFVLIVLTREGYRSRFAHCLVLGGMAAATLTAPYWFTVLQLQDLINIWRVKRTISQSVSWVELFTNTTPFHMFPWIPTIGIINPFYLCLGILGLILVRKTPLFWLILPPMFISIYMNTHMAVPLWHSVHATTYIQFPWRIASVAGILMYIAMLQISMMRSNMPGWMYRAFAIPAVVAATIIQPYLTYDTQTHHIEGGIFWGRRFVQPPPHAPEIVYQRGHAVPWTFANHDEFTPKWVDSRALTRCIADRRSRVTAKAQSGITGKIDKMHMPYRITGQVDIDAAEFKQSVPDGFEELPYITINQIYFPGWVGYVNGQKLRSARESNWMENPTVAQDPYGRMRIFFPQPGHYVIEAYYDGPPYWWLRNIVIFILLLAQWKLALWLKLVEPPQISLSTRRRAS